MEYVDGEDLAALLKRIGRFPQERAVEVARQRRLLIASTFYAEPAIKYELLGVIAAAAVYVALNVWLFYIALEPYVRRFWPQLLIGWTRALAGRLRDPLVGRDVLVGVAAGTIGALLIASRELIPRAFGLPLAVPELPSPLVLDGTRVALSLATEIARRAIVDAMQIVGIVVFLRIVLKQTWLVLALGTLATLPVAMSGTFAGQQLALEIAISLAGTALVFSVLLRFGLLALVITFYTFLAIESFPLTIDFGKPYGAAALLLMIAIASTSLYGFYASRGDEPLFGRPLLD